MASPNSRRARPVWKNCGGSCLRSRSDMPTFAYVCRDASGMPIKGLLEAEDASRAQAILQQQGYFITALQPRRMPSLFGTRPPSPEDIAAFTHQLAALIGAGLPLLAAL